MSLMKGKKGLIMGVANERSIAWGISQKLAEAANVLIGPALMALTLIPLAPKSLAKYFTLASKADLHTPITL